MTGMPTAVDACASTQDEEIEWLRASYEAFVQRRLQRGALSLRTRQGYERLRDKYQQRLRFVQDTAWRGNGENAVKAMRMNLHEHRGHSAVVEQISDEATMRKTNEPPLRQPVAGDCEVSTEVESAHSEPESEASALRQLVGVFFEPRIKRDALETLWPLAHHGGTHGDSSMTISHSDQGEASSSATSKQAISVLPFVPEWQELEQHKYYALMFKTLLWLFPGLPAFEAQELAERDWAKDCEFDAYGSDGLSFEGFFVSLVDLALACTDGSVDKCIEFLTQWAKQLETSLPIFRVPTTTLLSHPTKEDDETKALHYEPIMWRTVQLLQLFPCRVNARAQYLELKTKLSSAPIVLMVLAGNERPFELQLSTSAKLLVRERDHRSSVRRNTMHSGALAHFIEIERQFLWTFRSFPARPTLLIVPSALVSKRTLALYACCRALESHEHSLEPTAQYEPVLDPLMTLFSAVQEPFHLLYGAQNSLCGRIDRLSSKLLVIDHRGRSSRQFKILFKTSLIHNTSAAGGSGAAAVVASLAHIDSVGTAFCTSELVGGTSQSAAQAAAHSFIFVVKMTSNILATGPQKHWDGATSSAGKGSTMSTAASVPAQWFTGFCGANENKTIYVDTEIGEHDADQGGDADATRGVYYVYVFTLHGFYFEAIYQDSDATTHDTSTSGGNQEGTESPLSILTKQSKPRGSAGEDQSDGEDDWMRMGGPPRDKKAALHHVTTSATLLRQLLRLRKKRQACAQPPPECIGGLKITSIKSVTAAAGLRAKVLKARAVERRSRYLENEEALRGRVLAKLMKAEAKKRALRGDRPQNAPETGAMAEPDVIDADMSAKATPLSNFFKEMAVYHPTQREIDEAQGDEHGKEVDELMEHFADLFDDDHALHNLLDAEKWLTTEDRTSRRKSMMEDRVSKRRQTLRDLGKQQVPALDRHVKSSEEPGVDDDAKAKETKKATAASRASEDYFSTAMLIRDLMREVAAEEARESLKNTQELSVKSARVESLAASLGVAVAVSNPVQVGNGASEVHPLDDIRREDWLTSHYVHDVGTNAMLEKRRATLRPSFVPSSQLFEGQASQLPWQPVWEVPPDEAAELNQDFESDHGRQHRSPQPRPMTATGLPFVPRPPASQPATPPMSSAAAQSANLVRLNTRRIRSARAGSIVRQPHVENAIQPTTLVQSNEEWGKRVVSHVPQAFLQQPLGMDVDESQNQDGKRSDQLPGDAVEKEAPAAVSASAPVVRKAKEDEASQRTETIKPTKKLKRAKKKRVSREEKRFAQRVQELLSISPFGNA